MATNLYLFVALHLAPACRVYNYVFLSPIEQERNTHKYTATKGRIEYSVSRIKQGGFLKGIWQTETGQRFISFIDVTWMQSV